MMNVSSKCIHTFLRSALNGREICELTQIAAANGPPTICKKFLHTSSVTLGINHLPRGRHTIPQSQEQVEVSTEEWPYVERLLPVTKIPEPTAKPGEVMPSGWVAPSANAGDYPYHINRNANHMLPVYVKHTPILQRFITKVCHVEGDIYALGEELREYITEISYKKHAVLRVHEPHRMIQIKGQYVNEVKEYLLNKGF